METLNYLHDEHLIVELKPEEAETIQGGLQTFSVPYTTQGVSSRLRIRSRPSTDYRIVGYWYPGEIKYLESPAIVTNGFRQFSSSVNKWVSTQFIKRAPGKPIPD